MTQETELKKYAETIRCMSSVFDDIAAMLNLPKEQYGDPDALMDAIEALQTQSLSTAAKPVEVRELVDLLREHGMQSDNYHQDQAEAILSRYNVTKKGKV